MATFLKGVKMGINETGHWEIDGHHIRCSKCGCTFCRLDREGNKIPTNFCPECGIEMKNREDVM